MFILEKEEIALLRKWIKAEIQAEIQKSIATWNEPYTAQKEADMLYEKVCKQLVTNSL